MKIRIDDLEGVTTRPALPGSTGDALVAAVWEPVNRAPEILEDGERVVVWLVSNDDSSFEYWADDDWDAENQQFLYEEADGMKVIFFAVVNDPIAARQNRIEIEDTAFIADVPDLLEAITDLCAALVSEHGEKTASWPGLLMDAGDAAFAAIAKAQAKELT